MKIRMLIPAKNAPQIRSVTGAKTETCFPRLINMPKASRANPTAITNRIEKMAMVEGLKKSKTLYWCGFRHATIYNNQTKSVAKVRLMIPQAAPTA